MFHFHFLFPDNVLQVEEDVPIITKKKQFINELFSNLNLTLIGGIKGEEDN